MKSQRAPKLIDNAKHAAAKVQTEVLGSPLGSFNVVNVGASDLVGFDFGISPELLTEIRKFARSLEHHSERHVRHLAATVATALDELVEAIVEKRIEDAASFALLVGFYYGRLLLVPAEKEAADGQAFAAGRSKVGKKPKRSSVREWADKNLHSDWRNKPATQLARLAANHFKDRDFESLRRSFDTAKKVGR
jgi:hypothetical protein